MSNTRFTTVLKGAATGPTGIVVPPDHLDVLRAGKKPAVQVRINGYAYASTVGIMGGVAMIPFSAAHRRATGLSAGDRVMVELTLENAPRLVTVPPDLLAALAEAGLRASFDASAPSRRTEWARQVVEAKAVATRVRRAEKVLADLRGT